MNVLAIHSTGNLAYGADVVFILGTKSLETRSHKVGFLTTIAKDINSASTPVYDFSNTRSRNLSAILQNVTAFYYRSDSRKLARLAIDDFKPDVVHVHTIQGSLSGSVLLPFRERKIPIVQTMHDYSLLCPVNTFFLGGEICEACKNQRFYHAIAKRCYQGSLYKSTILSTGAYFTKYFYNYDHLITQYIAPGKFLREKMIEFGYSPDKITVLNNAYFGPTNMINSNNRSHILYVGRLAKHKGVDLLIAAASHLSIPVLIVGDGPERPNLESLANRMGAKQVRFLGFQPIDKVNELYGGAILTVFPSRWYENGPLVILESYANGTPVIGANIGAIPEFIEEGKSGYLFEANNAESLQQVLQRALVDPTALQRMGAYAKKMVRERYSPELYAQKLERILENVL